MSGEEVMDPLHEMVVEVAQLLIKLEKRVAALEILGDNFRAWAEDQARFDSAGDCLVCGAGRGNCQCVPPVKTP